jgi:hypothetical protein
MLFPGSNGYKLTSFGEEVIKHDHHHVFGIDKTSTPIGLLEVYKEGTNSTSLMIGKSYESKAIEKHYSDGTVSTVRELMRENDGILLDKREERVTFNLPLHLEGKGISENWILVSNHPLFQKKENLNDWIERSVSQYRYINKWFTDEGTFSKLPWSVEPGLKMGYGRNLSMIQDKPALDHYEDTKERYFYDMVINSITNLYIMQNKQSKLWETEYTSTWLKNEYGIKAPYIDTRHNDVNQHFIPDTHNHFNPAGNLI